MRYYPYHLVCRTPCASCFKPAARCRQRTRGTKMGPRASVHTWHVTQSGVLACYPGISQAVKIECKTYDTGSVSGPRISSALSFPPLLQASLATGEMSGDGEVRNGEFMRRGDGTSGDSQPWGPLLCAGGGVCNWNRSNASPGPPAATAATCRSAASAINGLSTMSCAVGRWFWSHYVQLVHAKYTRCHVPGCRFCNIPSFYE